MQVGVLGWFDGQIAPNLLKKFAGQKNIHKNASELFLGASVFIGLIQLTDRAKTYFRAST